MGLSYEACQSLDREGNRFVSWVDIRKDYFGVEWATDFVIHYVDGSMGIREIVTESMLSKRANIEKLEFSRRYWSSSESVKDWKNCTHEEGSVRICSLMLQERFTESVSYTHLDVYKRQSLSRATGTLSGGEAQRIRLATQIGSGLVGVAYILDEPSIGLHQRLSLIHI